MPKDQTIQLYRKTGLPAIADFVEGEPIWNRTTKALYILDSAGDWIPVGGNSTPQIKAITTKTANYTVLASDYTILADGASNTITITLPASPTEGQLYNIKCIDDTYTVTVARNGKTIDGDASDVTLIEDESITIQADSSGNWWII